MNTVAAITKNLINLIYPLHCPICKKSLDPLDDIGVCDLCLGAVKENPRPYCELCGRSIQTDEPVCSECRSMKFHFEFSRSACLYEGNLKELIHLFKYKRRISLAKTLSRLMTEFISEDTYIINGMDIVTFVPLQASRLRERSFNQSKVLALNISKEFNLPMIDALDKIRSTKPQNALAKHERLNNLNGAFKARADVRGKNILLIDDVMTTGATLSECAKVLLEAGANKVRCLTLARGK